MTVTPRMVVFSDLDGTLLDHDTYDWQPARPALDALADRGIPLVLVTSKTRTEVAALRTDLGHTHPYIVENGAATFVPSGFPAAGPQGGEGDLLLRSEGPPRSVVQEVLANLAAKEGFRFRTFAQLGTDGIAEATGLNRDAAAAANDRLASEPLQWLDSEQRLSDFQAALLQAGLRCVHGGRFLHVMGGFDKADAVTNLAQDYRRHWAPHPLRVMVCGDGPNDLGMLARADIAIVIAPRHGHAMPLNETHAAPTGTPTNSQVGGKPSGTPTNPPTSAEPSGTPTNRPTSAERSGTPTDPPTGGEPTRTPTNPPTSGEPTGTSTNSPTSGKPTGAPTDPPTGGEPTRTPTVPPARGAKVSGKVSGTPTDSPTGGEPSGTPTDPSTGTDPTGTPTIIRTTLPGPAGWCAAVLSILNDEVAGAIPSAADHQQEGLDNG